MDKDELKQSLTIEQISDLVAELHGEPQRFGDTLHCKTICHNGANELNDASHKLYYYDNSHLFKCFTECDATFDIFNLVQKVKELEGIQWGLPQCMYYVASFFGLSTTNDFLEEFKSNSEDWIILNKYDKSQLTTETQKLNLKNYDENILKYFPQPHIRPWEDEGISTIVMKHRGIKYDPLNHGIIIPHYDIKNNLIGIRERTLIEENEIYGKYRPAYINGKMYNHPLGYTLYNLNWSKANIQKMKIAVIFEGEKSCLKYASLFGEENDISVACCGSSLIQNQVNDLLSLEVNEIIIAFDKQFKMPGDAECKKWIKKLEAIHTKYSPFVNISFLFDKSGKLLGYKDSPIDCGKEVFLELFKERVRL